MLKKLIIVRNRTEPNRTRTVPKLYLEPTVPFTKYPKISGTEKNRTDPRPPLLATAKTKKHNKPANLLNKSFMKKEFSRMAKAVSTFKPSG
jgi:hypothetical protein